MKHGNISIFIPHLGCPHDCVFCNQRHISGTVTPPDPQKIREILSKAAEQNNTKNNRVTEIAFFGGSFTAIDREYMIALLDAAGEYSECFSGIRVSTRPDCIDDEVLRILKKKGVTDIELGVQSMNENVLTLCNRGHAAEDTLRASALIRKCGIGLGHQMMTGLPGDSDSGAIKTAQEIMAIKPDTVRIYPTLVIKDTQLEHMYRCGEYTPQSLEGAVELCSKLITMFEEADIRVIRVGLHSDGIEDPLIAGPFHPAFGELCESRIYRGIAENVIGKTENFSGKLYVNPSEISKTVGQHRDNIKYLSQKFGVTVSVHGDSGIKKREIVAK